MYTWQEAHPERFGEHSSSSHNSPEVTMAWSTLPCEIQDMVLAYTEPTTWSLTVWKYWYSRVVVHCVRHLDLSVRMVLNHSCPSSNYWAATSQIAAMTLSLLKEQLNNAICSIMAKTLTFLALQRFSFSNYLEGNKSWFIVTAETFQYAVESLSKRPLKHFRIDLPGAPFESRTHMNGQEYSGPHVCEIISQNFPETDKASHDMPEYFSNQLPTTQATKAFPFIE